MNSIYVKHEKMCSSVRSIEALASGLRVSVLSSEFPWQRQAGSCREHQHYWEHMSRAGVQLSVCLDVQIPGFNPTGKNMAAGPLRVCRYLYLYHTSSQKSI